MQKFKKVSTTNHVKTSAVVRYKNKIATRKLSETPCPFRKLSNC